MRAFLDGWFRQYLKLVGPNFWLVLAASAVFTIACSIFAILSGNMAWVIVGLQLTLATIILYGIALPLFLAILYAPFKTIKR